jgi:hypothetical protein
MLLSTRNCLNSSGPTKREARAGRELRGFLPLQLPPFSSLWKIFGTARSGPGRAVLARRRKIFTAFEKILWSAPWTARTVLKDGREGKGGVGFRGRPP